MAPQERPIDEAFRILTQSDIVRNHEKLPDGDAWILVRTILVPQKLVDANGTVLKEVVPPNGDLQSHLNERDPRRAVAKLSMGMSRIRKYLAFAYGCPLPFYCYLASKTFLLPTAMDVTPVTYHRADFMMPDGPPPEPWYEELNRCYSITQQLLDLVTSDSYLDRAISLVGDAYSSDDAEERFLYAWRAIEVVAAEDFGIAQTKRFADPEAIRPYVDRHTDDSLKGSMTRISGYTKALVSLTRRVAPFDEAKVGLRRLYKLRNVLAHGAANVEQFEEIAKAVPEMSNLALQAVSSRLQDEGLSA